MAPPTLIFVHGAWHSPAYWEPLITVLKEEGYTCLAPQLDFCGTDVAVPSIASSISQIQELITAETSAGRNVVLINHSFGGSVGCSSVKGFTKQNPSRLQSKEGAGSVIGIIQLCAFTPPANVSLYDAIGTPQFHHHGPNGWEIIDGGDPAQLFYNDLPESEGQKWFNILRKQSTATLLDRENVYPGWKDVKVWYLFCTKDNAIPIQGQEAMVKAARDAGAVFISEYLEAGHSPMLSKTEKVREFVVRALADF
jgi:pimeloyl-ACP methyl ester carboxylesterase